MNQHSYPRSARTGRPARQDGAVLVVAIIVMVVMMLASIALVRSVDTGNLIAGNLAFQRSATHSADAAVEAAIAWLESCNTGTNDCALGTLNADDPGNGYSASGNAKDANGNFINAPGPEQTWDQYWNATLAARPPGFCPPMPPAIPHRSSSTACAQGPVRPMAAPVARHPR